MIIILKKNCGYIPKNRISIRFEYEWCDANIHQWYGTDGNEHWEFDEDGLMNIRDLNANDIHILEFERRTRKN